MNNVNESKLKNGSPLKCVEIWNRYFHENIYNDFLFMAVTISDFPWITRKHSFAFAISVSSLIRWIILTLLWNRFFALDNRTLGWPWQQLKNKTKQLIKNKIALWCGQTSRVSRLIQHRNDRGHFLYILYSRLWLLWRKMSIAHRCGPKQTSIFLFGGARRFSVFPPIVIFAADPKKTTWQAEQKRQPKRRENETERDWNKKPFIHMRRRINVNCIGCTHSRSGGHYIIRV